MARGKYKSRVGTVVSDKMDKTVVVDVIHIRKHPRYKKSFKINTKFKAHDEKQECRVGDKVQIIETRPQSKTKRWRVSKILERGIQLEVEAELDNSGGNLE